MTPEEKAAKERELKELELQQLEEEEAAEQQAPAQKRTPYDLKPSSFEAFGLGAAGTLSPIAKYGTAAGIKARTAIEDLLQGRPSTGVPFGVAAETAEELTKAAEEQQPASYRTGVAAGLLGSLQAGALTKVPTFAKSLGLAAGTGALYGAGDVPYQQAKQDPLSLFEPALKGAAKGAALPLGAEAIARRGPVWQGVKAARQELKGEGTIGQIMGLPTAISEATEAYKGAMREPLAMKETVRQIAKQQPLEELPTAPKMFEPTVRAGDESVLGRVTSGTSITPEEEAQFLLNLLQQGKTPAKEFLTQKASQLYSGQIGPKQLEEILQIPLSQRVQARQFDPSAMGKQLKPQAVEARRALGKSGEAFKTLQEQASQEYKRTQLPSVSNVIKLAKTQFERPGTSAATKSTVEEIDMIINKGSALPSYGLTDGPLKSANAQEVYKRLQAAREYADETIQALGKSDKSVRDILQPIRIQLDEVLKSSPSKKIADALYSAGKDVEAFGIQPLMGKLGKKTYLSGKSIQEGLGDTRKGEQLQMGIEQARAFTKQFAEQLGPQETAKIDDFFNALAGAKSVADQKRLLDNVKFAEGPSGAAIRAGIERLSQTIKPAPSGAEMFRAAPEYLQSVDAFMADQAAKRFGKSYDQLTGKEQLKLVNMFQWFKENPSATMSEIESKFQTILRGTKK